MPSGEEDMRHALSLLRQRLRRRRRSLHALHAASVAAATLLAAAPVLGAPVPVAPETARLSPSGGLLEVRQQADVDTSDGVSRLHVALPAGAENFRMEVPGQTVARWHERPLVPADADTPVSVRQAKLREIHRVEGRLEALKARLALLSGKPPCGGYQDTAQQEQHQAEAIPALYVEKAQLEQRLPLLREELGKLPPEPGPGILVEVTLLQPVQQTSVEVRYTYTLKDCGWQPCYVFDARPDTGKGDKGDVVTVRFLAELWQNSGMDWSRTELTLVSGGSGPREPGRLPRWLVESHEPVQARAGVAADAAGRAAPMMLGAKAGNAQVETRAETASVFAAWTPATRGLPEGHSRMLVLEEDWHTPLQRLARPSGGDGRVWLTAHCLLPAERVWPAGPAEFLMDGQSVGQGHFDPRGGKAVLYFGPDPRVQVQATEDTRKRGEEGFINKSRTWLWAWTYTVHNTRDKAVTVRLERPMPQVVDKSVVVTYADTPEAQKDTREHKIFWDVSVPAGGSADVRHSLSITAPKDLSLRIDAP